MLKSLLLIAGLLIMAAPAEAHKRHHHRDDFHVEPFAVRFYAPWRQRIRLSDECVYKVWKDKIVCRY